MPRENHSAQEWRQQVNFIAQLYLDERLDTEEIAKRLIANGFPTSGSSVKAKLQKWRISRVQNETGLMASCYLHHQARGYSVSFKRLNVDVLSKTITDFISSHPSHPASDDPLPEHIQPVSQDRPRHLIVGDHHVSNQSGVKDSPQRAATTLPEERSQSQQREKKRKISSQPRKAGKAGDDSVNGTNNAPVDATDDEGGDDGDHNRQPQETRLKAMENAFATLHQLSSEHKESREAVDRAEKILSAALKDDGKKRLDENSTDYGPLHSAALQNSKSIAELLLSKGADVNATGGLGHTPMHCAVHKGHYAFVELLLQQPGINLNAVDHQGRTPLHYAFLQSWRHCALLLLNAQADVDVCDQHEKTALHYACSKRGFSQHVDLILKRTTKVNHQDINRRTPLAIALAGNDDDYVVPLLAARADVNIPDEDGRTPMMQACFEASSDTLLKLIDSGADLTVKGAQGETALHILCQREIPDVVQKFVQNPNININAKSQRGATPLMLAVASKHEKIVRILVANDADLNARDVDSDTALCMAIDRDYTKIAEFLIQSGSQTNPSGQSTAKWKSQFESEHVTEQELFALRSIMAQKGKTRQQEAQPVKNHSAQTDGPSSQQVRHCKIHELQALAQLAGMGTMQRTVSTQPRGVAEPQFTSSYHNPANGYTPYGDYSAFSDFAMNMGLDVDMSYGQQYTL